MDVVVPRTQPCGSTGFAHEAVFYEGIGGLVDAVVPFVREGAERGEVVLVALPPDRLGALAQELGEDADRVELLDMTEFGANPARLIPAWRRLLEEAGDVPVRGVGEPVWSGRRSVEVEEAVLHESLLSVAFRDEQTLQMLCPYDATALSEDVLREAARSHRGTLADRAADARGRFTSPLTPPPSGARTVAFGSADLGALRRLVGSRARDAGVGESAVDDLVLAAHELATNSVVHGGGGGMLSVWAESDAFVVEVDDQGVIDDLLVGRDMLDDLAENGRGIWMANQLCDLVQVRSGDAGTAVRLFSWL